MTARLGTAEPVHSGDARGASGHARARASDPTLRLDAWEDDGGTTAGWVSQHAHVEMLMPEGAEQPRVVEGSPC